MNAICFRSCGLLVSSLKLGRPVLSTLNRLVLVIRKHWKMDSSVFSFPGTTELNDWSSCEGILLYDQHLPRMTNETIAVEANLVTKKCQMVMEIIGKDIPVLLLLQKDEETRGLYRPSGGKQESIRSFRRVMFLVIFKFNLPSLNPMLER